MYSYIIGKIIKINKKSITFENNFIGYSIFVANPNEFQTNKIQKIYLYKHIINSNRNVWNEELYGFNSYEQKELFLNLLTVSGIGVKTAIMICKNNVNLIKDLIIKKSYEELSLLEYINHKHAKAIIDQLCESAYIKELNNKEANLQFDQKIIDIDKALKTLGYEKQEIQKAINKIPSKDLNDLQLPDLISQAIKLINNYEIK